MFAGRAAEGNVPLATGAVESGLGDLEAAERTRGERLSRVFLLHRLARNLLDFSFKFRRDFVNVLRTDQHASPLVSILLQTGLRALTNRGRQNVDHVVRELTDVLAHPD